MQLPCPKCGRYLEAPVPLPSLAQCPFCNEVFDPSAVGPVAGPPRVPPPITFVDPASPGRRVRAPATAILIVGGLNLLFALIDLVYGIELLMQLRRGQAPPALPPPFQQWVEVTPNTVAIGIAMDVLRIALAPVIIVGALKMRRLEAHGLALAASILSMVPCVTCCFCIGIPFGIWSLVVLSRPEIRSAFR